MARKIPSDISTRAFDCIIIGAGINGAGIAREAARRGLRILLLDIGLISIIGGKLTTYRRLAEQTVNKIVSSLKSPLKAIPSYEFQTSSNRDSDLELGIWNSELKLPGARVDDFDNFCREFKKENGELSEKTLAHLLRVYGTRARDVLNVAVASLELKEIFDAETGAIKAEVVFAFQDELAETLSDCLLRRAMVGLNADAGLNALDAAARVAEKYLGWSKEKVTREVVAYREYVARFHPRALSDTEI